MADLVQEHSKASGFRTSQKHYGTQLGVFPASGVLFRVTAVTTTTTVFKAEIFENLGNALGSMTLDNLFNSGFKIKVINATSAANIGVVTDITDFTSATGEFTTVALPATYTVGDILMLVADEVVSGTRKVLQQTPSGAVTAWVKGASHALFTVTGRVRINEIVAFNDIALVGATTTMLIDDSVGGSVLLGSVTCADMDLGDAWAGRDTGVTGDIFAVDEAESVILGACDIDLTLSNNTNINPGQMTVYIDFEPLSSDGNIVPATWD